MVTILASQIIKRFNYLSSWIATVICTTELLDKRVKLMKQFARIALELEKLRNWNSLGAFCAGFGLNALFRLKKTEDKFKKSYKKLWKAHQNAKENLSSQKSFKKYRELTRNCLFPFIPYLGVPLVDLSFICEGNCLEIDGLLNFRKFSMSRSILATMCLKPPNRYNIPPNPNILCFLHGQIILDDKELYECSIYVEPRPGSPFMYASWLLLSRNSLFISERPDCLSKF